MIWAVRLLTLAAVVLVALIARERPRHRPILVALVVAGVASLVRTGLRDVGTEEAARLSLALVVVAPMASGWAAAVALRSDGLPWVTATLWWMALVTVAIAAPAPRLWWSAILPSAHLAAVAVTVLAIHGWWRRGAVATVTERTLLVLLAGDIAAAVAPLMTGGPWALAQLAAGGAALGVIAVQVAELRRAPP